MLRSAITALGTLCVSAGLAVSPLAAANAAPSPEPPTAVSKPSPAKGAPTPSDEIGVAAADGRVYAYEHAFFKGIACGWVGHHNWWKYPRASIYGGPPATCWGEYSPNMLNRASALWNNGYHGSLSLVRFYKGMTGSGPRLCLNAGDYWDNLNSGTPRFSDGSWANDEIESHRWHNTCF